MAITSNQEPRVFYTQVLIINREVKRSKIKEISITNHKWIIYYAQKSYGISQITIHSNRILIIYQSIIILINRKSHQEEYYKEKS